MSRAICRRAERQLVSLGNAESVSGPARKYVNRLSDFLFVLGRALNKSAGRTDVLTTPRSKLRNRNSVALKTETAGVLDVNEKTKEASRFAGDGSGEAISAGVHGTRNAGFCSAHVIKLSGFEHYGVGRDGKQKYRYQEWFLRYVNGGA